MHVNPWNEPPPSSATIMVTIATLTQLASHCCHTAAMDDDAGEDEEEGEAVGKWARMQVRVVCIAGEGRGLTGTGGGGGLVVVSLVYLGVCVVVGCGVIEGCAPVRG